MALIVTNERNQNPNRKYTEMLTSEEHNRMMGHVSMYRMTMGIIVVSEEMLNFAAFVLVNERSLKNS